jgi:O-antigen ligase
MIRELLEEDYQSVFRSSSKRAQKRDTAAPASRLPATAPANEPSRPVPRVSHSPVAESTFLKRGHVLSFAALFVFTVVLYARPAEFYPSALTNSLALILGVITLMLFGITQVSLEGTLTARPREVNLVLLFALTGLLSIPLAIDPAPAWNDFSGAFIRGIATFIVIINVVRTEGRLKALLFVAVATAVVLSFQAMNAYRLGLMTVEGYRAAGFGRGIFANTNDMALHLVTMLPISIACFFGSRAGLWKVIHALCATVMIFGIFLSYSRGAFIGMLVVLVFFALKLRRGSKFELTLLLVGVFAAMLMLAPTGYGSRLLTIFMPALDASGSADSRRGELFRSIYVALRHPLLGIGMGNYQPNMSYRGLVTHNSYTQVAAEMGMTALVVYTMFIVSPLRKLSKIVRETLAVRQTSPFYYLGLGLQASLLVFMVSTFFLSVPYVWNVYYLIGYAVAFRRIYESATGKLVVLEKRKDRTKAELSRTAVEAAQPATA